MTIGWAKSTNWRPGEYCALGWRPWARGFRLHARPAGLSWAGRGGSSRSTPASASSSTSALASPTAGNVHEVAQRAEPEARVLYADRDRVAVAACRKLLAGNHLATVIQAALRDPAAILSRPKAGRLIDFAESVGFILVAVLYFPLDAEQPQPLWNTSEPPRRRAATWSYPMRPTMTTPSSLPPRKGPPLAQPTARPVPYGDPENPAGAPARFARRGRCDQRSPGTTGHHLERPPWIWQLGDHRLRPADFGSAKGQ